VYLSQLPFDAAFGVDGGCRDLLDAVWLLLYGLFVGVRSDELMGDGGDLFDGDGDSGGWLEDLSVSLGWFGGFGCYGESVLLYPFHSSVGLGGVGVRPSVLSSCREFDRGIRDCLDSCGAL